MMFLENVSTTVKRNNERENGEYRKWFTTQCVEVMHLIRLNKPLQRDGRSLGREV